MASDRIEKIRDRINLQNAAQRQADENPDDEVAADAADDLLDAISDNAILDVPTLLAEVDRLRAENAEYRQMQKAFKAHMRAVDQVAAPLAKDDGEGGKWHGGRTALLVLKDAVADQDRLRAENTVLAAALDDIAGMLPAATPSGHTVWIADAECCRMDKPCHQASPDDTGEWCPVCVAEVAWCAWKMGVLS